MATLSNTKWPTLVDVAKVTDPDGSIADIAEMMSETNEVLEDLPFMEGNLATGHLHSIRSGLPTPTWRKMYGGVQPTKSRSVQVTDSCGNLEDYAEVDAALAELNGNTSEFRLSEDAAHIEGISQTLSDTIFYGNEGTNPAAFTGLAPRYNSLSAANGDNIVNAAAAGGQTDLTSIWLCVWGDQTGFGIYPKGSKAGLSMTDKGLVTIENVDGYSGRMEAYRTHYKQQVGLTIRDWRYFVRVANIDVSELTTLANTKNLITWMIQAAERIPHFGRGRACFYVNRNIREKLRLGINEKVTNNLTWETVAGKRVMTFDDIPVRRVDSLLNTEDRVV